MTEKSGDQEVFAFTNLLADLKSELNKAVENAKKDTSGIEFLLDDVEIELQTVITQEKQANGEVKAKFWVIEAKSGSGVKYSDACMQKLKFKLSVIKDGKPLPLSKRK